MIVERWNGIPFEEPYQRCATRCASCARALAGEKVTRSTRRSASGFRSARRRAGADPRRRAARGDAAPRRPRGRRRHHQLAVGRRRRHASRRSCARRPATAGRPERRSAPASSWRPTDGRRHRAGDGQVRHRRLPERARSTPRSTSGSGRGDQLAGHVEAWKPRATARARWPPSPTRSSTSSSSTARPSSATSTCSATSPTASRRWPWRRCRSASTSARPCRDLAPSLMRRRAVAAALLGRWRRRRRGRRPDRRRRTAQGDAACAPGGPPVDLRRHRRCRPTAKTYLDAAVRGGRRHDAGRGHLRLDRPRRCPCRRAQQQPCSTSACGTPTASARPTASGAGRAAGPGARRPGSRRCSCSRTSPPAGYRPAPIEPGTWCVDLGIAAVGPPAPTWDGHRRRAPTPAVGPPFVPDPVDADARRRPRAGLVPRRLPHARLPLERRRARVAGHGRRRRAAVGLDFLPDHRLRHRPALGRARRRSSGPTPTSLIWPGREIITYFGHANAIGETRSVLDYRHGFEGVSLRRHPGRARSPTAPCSRSTTRRSSPGRCSRNFCRGLRVRARRRHRLGPGRHHRGAHRAGARSRRPSSALPDVGVLLAEPVHAPAIDRWEGLLRAGYRITGGVGLGLQGRRGRARARRWGTQRHGGLRRRSCRGRRSSRRSAPGTPTCARGASPAAPTVELTARRARRHDGDDGRHPRRRRRRADRRRCAAAPARSLHDHPRRRARRRRPGAGDVRPVHLHVRPPTRIAGCGAARHVLAGRRRRRAARSPPSRNPIFLAGSGDPAERPAAAESPPRRPPRRRRSGPAGDRHRRARSRRPARRAAPALAAVGLRPGGDAAACACRAGRTPVRRCTLAGDGHRDVAAVAARPSTSPGATRPSTAPAAGSSARARGSTSCPDGCTAPTPSSSGPRRRRRGSRATGRCATASSTSPASPRGGWDEPPAPCRRMAAALAGRYGLDLVGRQRQPLPRRRRLGGLARRHARAGTGTTTVVAILSLGAPRRLPAAPEGRRRPSIRLTPGHGDLVVLGGTCQRTLDHSRAQVRGRRLADQPDVPGARRLLTFGAANCFCARERLVRTVDVRGHGWRAHDGRGARRGACSTSASASPCSGFWGTWAVAALDIQGSSGCPTPGSALLVAATVVGTSVANVVGGTLAERDGGGPATGARRWCSGRLARAGGAAVPRPGRVDGRVPRRGGGRRDARRGPQRRVDRRARATGPGRLLRVHAVVQHRRRRRRRRHRRRCWRRTESWRWSLAVRRPSARRSLAVPAARPAADDPAT